MMNKHYNNNNPTKFIAVTVAAAYHVGRGSLHSLVRHTCLISYFQFDINIGTCSISFVSFSFYFLFRIVPEPKNS